MIKKKSWRLIFLSILFCGLIFSFGCQPTSNNQEPEPEPQIDVYVAGFTIDSAGSAPCYWKNGIRIDLLGIAGKLGDAQDIVASGDDIYISGCSRNNAGYLVPCYWKNREQRTDLPIPVVATVGWALAIDVSGEDVCLAGDTDAGEVSAACFWKNGAQTVLSVINAEDDAEAKAICLSGGDVYICGYTSNALLNQVPCFWKNENRIDLDMDGSGYANGICVSGSDVYVAGGSMVTPCYWKNGIRENLSVLGWGGWVMAMCISGSDVYISGCTMNGTGTAEFPCYWKNGERTDLSVLEKDKDGEAYSIFVAGNDIYVAGFVLNSADVKIPCYWKNGERTNLTIVDTSQGGWARGIAVIHE